MPNCTIYAKLHTHGTTYDDPLYVSVANLCSGRDVPRYSGLGQCMICRLEIVRRIVSYVYCIRIRMDSAAGVDDDPSQYLIFLPREKFRNVKPVVIRETRVPLGLRRMICSKNTCHQFVCPYYNQVFTRK